MPHEPFRPFYHFTPPSGWMNDPNGLVYFQGEYHLFYQHNPADTVWGPMHWGHAVSRDLLNWEHLPIALYPDDVGAIFSGSAVIDWRNTAGFGEEAMVAIFTHDKQVRQMQSLAYSTDRGRTWTKYEGNPVLDPPNNLRDFRDPKVFWYDEGADAGHWVMAVAAGSVILFFTSPDLKHWEASGSFGWSHGIRCGVWETPDLFQLPIDGGPEARWALTVGIGLGDCAPAGGSGVQYFVGQFDGQTFHSDNPPDTVLWADFGPDFYAAQGWNEAPDRSAIWIGWMNNWRYAEQIPTGAWRGAFSLPRALGLTHTPDGLRLTQQPLSALATLRGRHHALPAQSLAAGAHAGPAAQGLALEIIAEFAAGQAQQANRLGVRLRHGGDQVTTVGYALKTRALFVDRTRSGQVDFNPNFPGIHTAAYDPADDRLRLHLFVDASSLEVFAGRGEVVFSECIFPQGEEVAVEIFADGGPLHLLNLNIYELQPARWLSVHISSAHVIT